MSRSPSKRLPPKVVKPVTGALAGTWDLVHTEAEPVAETAPINNSVFESVEAAAEASENVIGPDVRKLVPAKDFGPQGKYRALVKLQMIYENQESDSAGWFMGTGWLIRPDVVVTAGHCVYNFNTKASSWGRVSQIKAYIGYNGKASLNQKDAQFRSAKSIVTTDRWLAGGKTEAADVGLILLEKPFTGVKPIKFENTPNAGKAIIGIVGYPADKSLNGESGAQMYEAYKQTEWDDVNQTKDHTLHYKIPTFGGQSGSPVIRKDRNTCIGVHVWGDREWNSASTFGGRHGNNLSGLLSVLGKKLPVVKTSKKVKYVKIPLGQKGKVDQATGENAASGGVEGAPEGAGKMVAKILGHFFGAAAGGYFGQQSASSPETSPFIGSFGTPMTVLAGSIAAIQKYTTESGEELSESDQTRLFHRAMLAEAALQTALQMDVEYMTTSGIMESIESGYTEISKSTKKIRLDLIPIVIENGLRMVGDYVNRHQSYADNVGTGTQSALGSESLDESAASFVQGLTENSTAVISPPSVSENAGPEFWGLIARGALTLAGGLFNRRRGNRQSATDSHADMLIVQNDEEEHQEDGEDDEDEQQEGGEDEEEAPEVIENTETLETEDAEDTQALTKHVNDLVRRSVIGESALQALLNLPSEELKSQGVFDGMRTTLGKIQDWFKSSNGREFGRHGPLSPPFSQLRLLTKSSVEKPEPTDGDNDQGEDPEDNGENGEDVDNGEDLPNGEDVEDNEEPLPNGNQQAIEPLRTGKRKPRHGPHLAWYKQLAVQG